MKPIRYKKYFLDWLWNNSPKAYLQLLRDTKGSGHRILPYKDKDKLHKEYVIRNGVVRYWIYYRSGRIVNCGVEK